MLAPEVTYDDVIDVTVATQAIIHGYHLHITLAHLYCDCMQCSTSCHYAWPCTVCVLNTCCCTYSQLVEWYSSRYMQTVSAPRVTDLAYEDVLPAFQLTLKNLQLDYLDLYLIHWSTRLTKTAQLGNLKEEDKLGYQPEFFSRAWEVSWDKGWMWILPVG